MTPLVLAAWTLAGLALPQDLVDNPEFQRWTPFEPGAWVKHRSITEDPSGKKEGESLLRLLEKKADRMTVHLATTLDLKDPTSRKELQREILPKIDRTRSPEHLGKKSAEATEELEVGGRKLKCARLEYKGPELPTLRLWLCPEIPGAVVRMEFISPGPNPATHSMQLISWKSEDSLPVAGPVAPPPNLPAHQIARGPQGKLVAWMTTAPNQVRITVNGVEGPEFLTAGFPPLFSRDGARFAYIGRKGMELQVIVDHKMVDSFRWDRPGGSTVLFSPDGSHVVWMRQLPTQQLAVVVDGKAGRSFDRIDNLSVGPDGRPTYTGVDPSTSKSYLVTGDEAAEVPAGQEVRVGPQGKSALLARVVGGKVQLTVDGKKSDVYSMIQGPFWSPDGSRMMYVAFGSPAECVAVVDGKKSEAYRSISIEQIRFSADGKRLAYVAFPLKGNGVKMVIDGKATDEAGVVRTIVFSDDGRRVGYVVSAAATNAVIDGKKGPAFAGIDSLIFSPDGRHVAYVAQRNSGDVVRQDRRFVVVVDGKTGEDFERIEGIEFGPSGKDLRFSAQVEGRTAVRVLKVD